MWYGQTSDRVLRIWSNNIKQVFHDDIKEVSAVSDYITDHTLLLCDGGNKQAEANLYASYIKKNSLMMVHDRDTEYNSRVLVEELSLKGLTVMYEQQVKVLLARYTTFARKS